MKPTRISKLIDELTTISDRFGDVPVTVEGYPLAGHSLVYQACPQHTKVSVDLKMKLPKGRDVVAVPRPFLWPSQKLRIRRHRLPFTGMFGQPARYQWMVLGCKERFYRPMGSDFNSFEEAIAYANEYIKTHKAQFTPETSATTPIKFRRTA